MLRDLTSVVNIVDRMRPIWMNFWHVLLRGFARLWMRRNRSSCWWISMWWWGVVTVPTLSSSTAPSSERSRKSTLISVKWSPNCSFSSSCQNIVFSLFQGDCWICMELMSTSLDKFYKYVYCVLDDVIPEEILGKITLAVSIHLTFFSLKFTLSDLRSIPEMSWGFNFIFLLYFWTDR